MTNDRSIWGASLLAVGIASLLPLLATWWLATRPAMTTALLPRLILVASGALVGAACFHLIPDALVAGSALHVGGLVVLGVLSLAALERVIHSLERPSAAERPHAAHGHAGHLMPLGIASDALHNTIDGALIATAFVANPSLGMFAGAAIALHELPRELGTFALCVEAGMSPKRAILVNAGTGVLALLGASLALLVGTGAQRFGVMLVPFAAGNFLYLAGAILVAQRGRAWVGDGRLRAWYVVAGIAVTALLAGRH
ncbi:MAG: ZIP family metal transporter [Gemmatimonadaceae bacterium]|nr:ZIP family metal transporter [Gemmatimonadaceae bacterium]